MDNIEKQLDDYLYEMKNKYIKNYNKKQLLYGNVAGYNKCCIDEFLQIRSYDRKKYQDDARKILMKKNRIGYIHILCTKCSKMVINDKNYDLNNYLNIQHRNNQIELVNDFIRLHNTKFSCFINIKFDGCYWVYKKEFNEYIKYNDKYYINDYILYLYITFVRRALRKL